MLRRRSLAAVFLSFFAALALSAQTGRLVSGPMLGYQTHREVLIWVETADAQSVRLTYHPAGQPDAVRSQTASDLALTPAGTQVIKFIVPLLEMGQTYSYSIAVDDTPVTLPYALSFKTTAQWEWRSPPPDFSFLFGSCAYFNDPPYDRPGTPYGAGTEIFQHMAKSGADFMLWGGDNLYLRESDWSSESGIWYRYSKDRSTPDLQPLLAAMPQYATWDDHDFGPNNSNTSYELKQVSLEAFQTYWGNRTYGEPDNPGVYGKFQWGDAAFFLLDNRYHRDESETDEASLPEKSQIGREQLDWLRQNLISMNEGNNVRHSPIRFIVLGTQFLSDRIYNDSEGHSRYKAERDEILEIIRTHQIPGVIFLTGDVHYTELVKRTDLTPYPLYELSSSPMASGALSRELHADPNRIEGTAVQTQNYCRIAFSGPASDRVITITCYSKTNEQLWQQVIRANDLKWPTPSP